LYLMAGVAAPTDAVPPGVHLPPAGPPTAPSVGCTKWRLALDLIDQMIDEWELPKLPGRGPAAYR
jgi:hypothetical protein